MAETETHSNRLVAVVIEVSDLERSAELYRHAFGVSLKPADDHRGSDRWTRGKHTATSWTHGAFLHFALYAAKTETPTRGVQLGFEVRDIEASHKEATEAGAEVIHGPRSQPWGKSARYRDFDGNVIELSQLPARS